MKKFLGAHVPAARFISLFHLRVSTGVDGNQTPAVLLVASPSCGFYHFLALAGLRSGSNLMVESAHSYLTHSDSDSALKAS